MTRFRPSKPSPAMVVAALALLVALGGTGVAAVAVAVPRNSVGTVQLKNNAVTSLKVRNGSLRRIDFLPGSIPRGPIGPRGPAGPAGPAGAAGVAAPGYVAEVLSQTSTNQASTSSTSYKNLDSGSVTVNVPSGETDKLIAFFSGASACYGGSKLQRCVLRITVDGNELSPAGGSSAYFDNNDLGKASPNHSTDDSFNPKKSSDVAQHAIVRTSGSLSSGSHTVQVQYATTDSSTTFGLADYALVVQRVKAS